eukprot:Phypoly_transcript_06335.p1 GENE.Phypoly_transcript_06335~~Phypoly_transcript_06335.p1  ORF type:complete len:463 (+),score=151.48 Phypoly_transcript_06335:200-1588(+)
MEKRVGPRSRPGSRDGPSLSPSPSSFLPTSTSSPSSSLRNTELDPLPPSLAPRPLSSPSLRPHSPSSRPHSPNTLPPLVSPPPPPSSSVHSPQGSPLVKRRSIPSPFVQPDSTFLTSLRGASSTGSYVEPEGEAENQSFTGTTSMDNINGEVATENGNGNSEELVRDPEELARDTEELARIDAEQAARRAELDSYMTELQGKKDVVVFPKNFTELLETIESDQTAISNFWAKFMMDPQIENPWMEDEQLAKGLERIRKLDIILAKKTKQARELRKVMQPNKPAKEEEKKEKGKQIPGPPTLTQTDERRLEALLVDELAPNPHEELHTPFDELENLYELDVKLAQIVDVSEWEEKGLAHLRPTSASSRASYASYSSVSSYASRSSQVSRASNASRTSSSGQALTELEKEEEEREKARLRDIDAQLRTLTNADAEGDAQARAPPEQIRRLVRMYSTPSVPPPLV